MSLTSDPAGALWAARLGPPRRWLLLDGLAAALFAVPAGVVLANEAGDGWSVVLAPVVLALIVAGIVGRRLWPILALFAQVAAVAALVLAEPRAVVVALCGLGYTLYAVASTHRLRAAALGLVAALLAALSTLWPDVGRSGGAVLFAIAYCLVWFVGVGVGLNRRYTSSLLAQQAELSEAALRRARGIVVEQRLQIARDLHDVVAHGLSVVTVQAGYGGLVVEQQPERAREALAVIESVSRQTLTEMRQLLRVLRRDDGDMAAETAPELAPAPVLADLEQLVARARTSGLQVELSALGKGRPLPAGIEAAAYRTVQEAVTNAVKHAGAQRIQVLLRYSIDELTVEVTDDGWGCDGHPVEGYGLVGMRERALLYGGAFRAGNASGNGFQIVSTFPLEHPVVGRQIGALATAEPTS